MTIRPSWRSSALVPLALLSLVVAAYPWAYRSLPPRPQLEPHMEVRTTLWEDGLENWFGHGVAASYGFAAGLLTLLFAARYFVVTRSGSPAAALAWYALLLASVLPCVWLLVVLDWGNIWVSPLTNWVGIPLALLGVPTAFLIYDAATGRRPPPGQYAARCLLEVMLVPAWAWFVVVGMGWADP
jgi:hypothetical protein